MTALARNLVNLKHVGGDNGSRAVLRDVTLALAHRQAFARGCVE